MYSFIIEKNIDLCYINVCSFSKGCIFNEKDWI